MDSSRRPGPGSGLAAGAMLTAALIGVFYAGWKILGLPFVPFDVFDFMARVLPGKIIAFGISSMVAIISALHPGPTAVVAKAMEQTMGIISLWAAGVLGGAVLFLVLRASGEKRAYTFGKILGLIFGASAAHASYHVGKTATVSPGLGVLCILLLYLIWGVALGWSFIKMQRIVKGIETLPGEPAAGDGAWLVNRRRFLIRLGGATAVITLSGTVLGVLYRGRGTRPIVRTAGQKPWSATHAMPNAADPVKPAPGTRLEFTPLEQHYRIDINTIPPTIMEQGWRLQITGLVDRPRAFGLEQIKSYEPMHQFITLSCISNRIGGDLTGTQRWSGTSLIKLLPEFGLKPEATHLKISSADGFFEFVPVELIKADPRIMFCYEWDGLPLEKAHGFPLRIYIPDLYGMKQPKWIEKIEAVSHWEPGYWVVRGWDKVARMRATSVIDTIAVDKATESANGKKLVPIGGIAHAGVRGISRVEVKIDDGLWTAARLRAPLSRQTWVVWRYDMPFEPGRHKFTVRCFEGDGTPQITQKNPPDPSGATGLQSKTKNF
jgi:DMSO/TMAO reductase YedYZ molybdopterin-dependent catalytic subunit